MAVSLESSQQHQFEFEYVDTDRVTDELLLHYGLQPFEVNLAKQQAEVMLPYTRVVTRTTLTGLEGIVRDGRLKTVNETQTSAGLTAGMGRNLERLDEYIKMRQQFEVEQLNWTDSDPYIVYGFLGYSDELGDTNIQAPAYGRVELKLRPEVADRSTFTVGDSLSKAYSDYLPVDFINHSDATLVQQAIEFGRQYNGHELNQLPYIEAQVHGGVGIHEIEYASITIEPEDLEHITSLLSELHMQAPDCKIGVNLDYTTSETIPSDAIRLLPFVEFTPVVISNTEPISILRNSPGYECSGGKYYEYLNKEKQQLLGATVDKISEKFANNGRPINLKHPILSHIRDGYKFPQNDKAGTIIDHGHERR